MFLALLGPEILRPMRKTQVTGWGKDHRRRTVMKGPMHFFSSKNVTHPPRSTFLPQVPPLPCRDATCSLSPTVSYFHLDSSNKIASTDTMLAILLRFLSSEQP